MDSRGILLCCGFFFTLAWGDGLATSELGPYPSLAVCQGARAMLAAPILAYDQTVRVGGSALSECYVKAGAR